MSTPFTHTNLNDVKDSAPEFGLGDTGEARFAKDAVDGETLGLSLHRVKPDQRQPFGHFHEDAEEVYVVLSGSGRMKLDDEIIDIGQQDAIRVAPPVTRAFEAGPDGLEVLAFGPRHDGDGGLVQDWWTD